MEKNFNLSGKRLGVSDPRTKVVKIPEEELFVGDMGEDCPSFDVPDEEIKKKKNIAEGCRLFKINEKETIKVFNTAESCKDEEGLPVWSIGVRLQYKDEFFNGAQELLFSQDKTVRKSEYVEGQLPNEIIEAIEKAIKNAERNSKNPPEDSFI